MNGIEIRSVQLSDLLELQKISRQTFFETFASVNSKENMNKYLEANLSASKITDELNDRYSEFYFALHDKQIIGYLKINFGTSQTELQDKKGMEIERIYVLKEFQGKKIGQLLYGTALTRAMQNNVEYIWLGVWEKNQNAIKFYQRNGFVKFDEHIFKLGNDEQTDIMMKLMLAKNEKQY